MNRRTKVLIVILALLLAWIFAAPFLAENLIVEKTLEKADAILVLGGSSTYIERTNAAARLYRNGAATKILLTDDGEKSGWSKMEKRNVPYVELARRNLTFGGVPSENIEILQPASSGTIYEARALAEKASNDRLRSVLIVTSAYHTRRALWTFERIFGESDVQIKLGIVAVAPGEQTPPPFRWWLEARGWQTVAGEYVKFAVYWAYY